MTKSDALAVCVLSGCHDNLQNQQTEWTAHSGEPHGDEGSAQYLLLADEWTTPWFYGASIILHHFQQTINLFRYTNFDHLKMPVSNHALLERCVIRVPRYQTG